MLGVRLNFADFMESLSDFDAAFLSNDLSDLMLWLCGSEDLRLLKDKDLLRDRNFFFSAGGECLVVGTLFLSESLVVERSKVADFLLLRSFDFEEERSKVADFRLSRSFNFEVEVLVGDSIGVMEPGGMDIGRTALEPDFLGDGFSSITSTDEEDTALMAYFG